jgi:hypothetical protein
MDFQIKCFNVLERLIMLTILFYFIFNALVIDLSLSLIACMSDRWAIIGEGGIF